MNIEEQLNKVLFEIIKENKIPYTQEGIENLLKLTYEKLGAVSYEIKIQPLTEISADDIAQRRLPKIEIVVK